MRKLYNISQASLVATLMALSLGACTSDERPTEGSVVEIPAHRLQLSELDSWIDATFLPYGIEVVYRWDKHAVAYGSYAYPPAVERVKPVLELIKTLCLDLYNHTGAEGRPFLQAKTPLRIYLFGGKGLDSRGFELVSAPKASALELYVYNVNAFEPSSDDAVYSLIHSVHHQLLRRLMELYPYDRDAFRRLSDYSEVGIELAIEGQAKAQTARERFGVSSFANSDGFLTIYGMLDSEADFADMITVSLCNHPEVIRAAQSRAAQPILKDENPEVNAYYEQKARRAAEALLAKQRFVEDYYRRVVGRRLSEMQLRSLELISNYKQANDESK